MIFMLFLLFSTSDIKKTEAMVKLVEFYDLDFPDQLDVDNPWIDDTVNCRCLLLPKLNFALDRIHLIES